MSDTCVHCGHYLREDEYRLCDDCRRLEEQEADDVKAPERPRETT